MGPSQALDAWKGAVRHETVTHAGLPVDVYGEPSSSPLLIVHGVNPTGKNSLDLVRISEALAQVGYQVFIPDFAEMKKLHLQPEEVDRIRSVFQFIGKESGIACFSYGCGPALIAAANPDLRNHVRFVIAFGGYFDIREALEFVITGPTTSVAYLKWFYLRENSDLASDETDRPPLRTIAEHHLYGTPLESNVADKLSPEAKSLLDVFTATTPAEFRARLNAAPQSLQRRLDALSPAAYVGQMKAPLLLIHGMNDPVIPSEQSVELAAAARRNGLNYSLTLLRIYGHVAPTLPDVSMTSFFSFYLPETIRFLWVVNRVVGLR